MPKMTLVFDEDEIVKLIEKDIQKQGYELITAAEVRVSMESVGIGQNEHLEPCFKGVYVDVKKGELG